MTEEQKKAKKAYNKKWNEINKEKVKGKREDYLKKYYQEKKDILKLYYLSNKEEISKKNKKKYIENKEEILIKNKKYYNDNKKKLCEQKKVYRHKNKEKININKKEYVNKRKKNDITFKLKLNIKCLIRNSIFNKGLKKNSKTSLILGCSFDEFRLYIESKFEPWMIWDNYGKYNGQLNCGWDLDHIIPSSSAKSIEDIIKLNHYTNFQPLCSKINRDIKRNL